MTTTMRPPFLTHPIRARSLLRDFVLSPFDPASWRAAAAILLGLFTCSVGFGLVASTFSTGGSLLIILVGIAVIGIGIEIARLTAQVERWRMTFVDPRPLRPHPYRTLGRGIRALAEAEFMDENRWRDVIYVLVSFPLAVLEFVLFTIVWSICIAFLVAPLVYYEITTVAGDRIPYNVAHAMPVVLTFLFIAGVLMIPVGATTSRGLMKLHRAVVQGLLCQSEAEELRRRVDTLRDSRSAMLQIEASELRRIERDLHDGAQQRLVMLAIDLSLARDKVESDPTAAKSLMDDAREQARQALAELRDLVRGSAPAILLDRGLIAALGAVAGRCPVPTVVESTLVPGERQPHAVERAAYFVVSEALTNVAKHSAATRCEVRCGQRGDWLIVEVWDDGKGGASMAEGGGLAGLRDRVEALDGRFGVSSPAGGPTVLHAEFPVGGPSQ
jgi:signal transduction histidine kinase